MQDSPSIGGPQSSQTSPPPPQANRLVPATQTPPEKHPVQHEPAWQIPPVQAEPSWLPRVHGSEYGVPSPQLPLLHSCGVQVREPLLAQSAKMHAPQMSGPHCVSPVQVVVVVVFAVVVVVVLVVVVMVDGSSGAHSSFAAARVTVLLPN